MRFLNIFEIYYSSVGIQVGLPIRYEVFWIKLKIFCQEFLNLRGRLPAKTEMEIYKDSGVDVYMIYFDMKTKFDILTEDLSCCGVGHGTELLYLFG